MEVIYTKFSNDREEGYRIRTDIVLDGDKKRVFKRPTDAMSIKHINHTFEMYDKLTKCFANTCFEINKTKKDGNSIELEYLEGMTLDEYLGELLQNGNKDEFITTYKKYLDNVLSVANVPFEETKEYNDVFGEFTLQGDYKSISITDVDLIFSNVVVSDDKWTLIDYEWTYDFLIPVKFVLFRTIHYFLAFGREEQVKSFCDMYEYAGISECEKEFFEKCEFVFQQSLMGEHKSLWMINDELLKGYIYPMSIAENESLFKKHCMCKIIITYADGSEEEITKTPVITSNKHCVVAFDFLFNEVTKIYIECFDKECIVDVCGIVFSGENGQKFVTYDCEGQEVGNNKYAFFDKATFVVEDVPKGASSIYFEYVVSEETKRKIMSDVLWREGILNKMESDSNHIMLLEGMLDDRNNELEDKNRQFELLNDEHNHVVDSKAWKVLSMLRRIKRKIKLVFGAD